MHYSQLRAPPAGPSDGRLEQTRGLTGSFVTSVLCALVVIVAVASCRFDPAIPMAVLD